MSGPADDEVTVDEAAAILGRSPDYFARLLDRGVIPFRQGVTGRAVRVGDVLRHDEESKAALHELFRLSEEYGFYDEDTGPQSAPPSFAR